MKQLLRNLLRQTGFDLVRCATYVHPDVMGSVPDLSLQEQKTIMAARPFTMTSMERMAALINALNYVHEKKIPGDIAECGVWRGGSMMIIALTLMSLGDTRRNLYLYDTFEGMPPPTDADKDVLGIAADKQLEETPKDTGVWCYASLEDVKANVLSTGYPADKIHFIKGKVEDTIPQTIPSEIALLRLDTDWYESTKHELDHLYPLLHKKGVLIIDDYGHWQGARKAVDEYFADKPDHGYLHRIDYTGRILVRSGV